MSFEALAKKDRFEPSLSNITVCHQWRELPVLSSSLGLEQGRFHQKVTLGVMVYMGAAVR